LNSAVIGALTGRDEGGGPLLCSCEKVNSR
jgi:hypothetical protein